MEISNGQLKALLTILVIVLFIGQSCGGIASNTPSLAVPTAAVALTTNTPGPSPAPTSIPPSPQPTHPPTDIPMSPSPAPLTKAAIASCPVTIPNGSTPPFEEPSSLEHGNGDLWTAIQDWGKVGVSPRFVNTDGSINLKWLWWRGVRGKLTVEGRRLDAPAPPAQGYYDTPGYGDSGFQAGGILFPSEGCWEISGRVGNASLTFVTLVVKVPFEIPWPSELPEGLLEEDVDIRDLPQTIRFIFGPTAGGDGKLIFEVSQGMRAISTPAPIATQQPVLVHGQPGMCVQGAQDKQGQWRADADAGMLEWTVEGFSYRISHTGLGLRCDDLVRIAESVR